MAIISSILSLFSGGLTGLLGNCFTAFINYKNQQVSNKHELDLMDAKEKLLIARTNANIKISDNNLKGDLERADSDAYVTSQKTGDITLFSNDWVTKLLSYKGKMRFITIPFAIFIATLFGLVDFLKALMRPGLTLYLTILTSWLTFTSWKILQAAGVSGIDTNTALSIFTTIIDTIIYLTISCVTWWFGDRRMAKYLTKMKEQKQSGDIYNIGL